MVSIQITRRLADFIIILFLLYFLFIRRSVEKTLDPNRPIAIVGIEKVAAIFDRSTFERF